VSTTIICPECRTEIELLDPDDSPVQVCSCMECGAVFDYDGRDARISALEAENKRLGAIVLWAIGQLALDRGEDDEIVKKLREARAQADKGKP